MHCILIGVTGPSSSSDNTVLWNTVTQFITTVEANERQNSISWISRSTTRDEEGRSVILLCCTTEAHVNVDDVIDATSSELGDPFSCELWASAPAILPLRPIEGYDSFITLSAAPCYHHDDNNNDRCQHHSDHTATTITEWAASTMKEWGIFTQSTLITAHEVMELKQCIDEEISIVEKLIQSHSPDIIIGKDVISFQEIASRGKERFDLLLSPTSRARQFVEQVLLHRISPILERILDGRMHETINFDISVVYSKPNAPNQGWHADGDHQKGTNDAGWDATNNGWKCRLAEPYAICLFIPLIDLDDDTGYTQFWPASHRYRGLAGFGPVAEIAEATYDGKCRAGDAIWYDYRLMHRGMKNMSNVLRPVLQVLFKKTWYVEKRNYGTVSLRRKE